MEWPCLAARLFNERCSSKRIKALVVMEEENEAIALSRFFCFCLYNVCFVKLI